MASPLRRIREDNTWGYIICDVTSSMAVTGLCGLGGGLVILDVGSFDIFDVTDRLQRGE